MFITVYSIWFFKSIDLREDTDSREDTDACNNGDVNNASENVITLRYPNWDGCTLLGTGIPLAE